MKWFTLMTLVSAAQSSVGALNRAGTAPYTPTESPRNLRDSITAAVQLNPKTVSTDELLESIHFSTLATKADMYPNGSVSCGVDASQSSNHYASGLGRKSKSMSSGCRIGVSGVLYDGKAGYYRYLSAKANEEAITASYNTADSLMTNTRGGLAHSTMMVYMSMAQFQDHLDFVAYVKGVLETFKKVDATDNNLISAIDQAEQSQQQFTDILGTLKVSFRNLTTLDPAEKIDNMDQTIESMKVPANPEDAVRIALSEGPEVKRRNSNVQMAEYSLKAIRASVGPLVTFSASVGRGRNHDFMNSELDGRGTNATVGVQIVIPLDRANHYRVQSAVKNLDSKKSEREAAIKDAENEIRITYRELEGQRNVFLTMHQNFEKQKAFINGLVQKIEAGQSHDLKMENMVKALETLSSQYNNMSKMQQSILMDLFSIQQVTGLLFTSYTNIPL